MKKCYPFILIFLDDFTCVVDSTQLVMGCDSVGIMKIGLSNRFVKEAELTEILFEEGQFC